MRRPGNEALEPRAPALPRPPLDNVALATTADPGSFRDRNGTVYHRNGEILRGISAAALANWERLSAAPFLREAIERGSIVRTERLDDAATRSLGGDWAAVLRHEAVPFISYPYEWTFGMLKDAALLHLDLMLAALPSRAHPQGRLRLQYPVAGGRAGLHRYSIVRDAFRRRAVDRLPAILRAVPLPLVPAGL